MRQSRLCFCILILAELAFSVRVLSASPSLDKLLKKQGFQLFSMPSSYFAPGLVYLQPKSGQSAVIVDDLARLADLSPKDVTAAIPSFSQRIKNIGSLLGRVVGPDLAHDLSSLKKSGGGRVEIEMTARVISLVELENGVSKSSLLQDYQGKDPGDFYVIVETVAVKRITIEYGRPFSTDFVDAIKTEGREITILDKNKIEVEVQGLPAFAFRAARLLESGKLVLASPKDSAPRSIQIAPVRMQFIETDKDMPPVPLVQEGTDGPTHIWDWTGNQKFPRVTFGTVYLKIKEALEHAGFDEFRTAPFSTGFVVLTRLEVTSDDGQPLIGQLRFFTDGDYRDRMKQRGEGAFSIFTTWTERRRGFGISCGEKSSPLFSVNSHDPEGAFSMRFGYPDLPRGMEVQAAPPSLHCRVLVFEFTKRNNESSKLLPNGACGANAADHMRQSHLSLGTIVR